MACESMCSGTLSSTRFSLNSCSHSGISEYNGSLRYNSWSWFLFGFGFLVGLVNGSRGFRIYLFLGFCLAWSTGRPVLFVQHVNLTQVLDGNLSHSDLPMLESPCRLTQVVVGEVDELEEDVG